MNSDKTTLQNQINSLDSQIDDLDSQIRAKDSTIKEQQQEIRRLELEIETLEEEKAELESKLGITTELYEEAKPYQERVERGQQLHLYYNLLDDREEYAKPIILDYLGLSYPVEPSSDDTLWERGRKVYNWLSDNYQYCGDKGLRVGTTFYEFQFYSPDELLMSDNVRCGDCDDFATLFAGLMYASGVPEDKVWVVCGSVPEGGHCWNWLSLEDKTYRIDPVCSQEDEMFNFFGISWGVKGAYYTSSKGNVDCFSSYDTQMRMNPNGYYSMD